MTVRRPRCLMIAPAMPASGGNGLAMRLGVFLEALARTGDTTLVVVPIAGPADACARLPAELGVDCTVFDPHVPDTHLAMVMRTGDAEERLLAFRRYGKPTLAGQLSLSQRTRIGLLLSEGNFDVVHISRLYLGEIVEHAFRAARKPCWTLDLDDDDAAAFQARSEVLRNYGYAYEGDWAAAEAQAFRNLAARLLNSFDMVFAAAPCALAGDIVTVSNCVAFPTAPARADDGRTLLFVGNLNYAPNSDGVLWFAKRIWPRVRAGASELRVSIVGHHPPKEIAALHGRNNIAVHAEVADLTAPYTRAMLAIAPLRSGGGTRIKLIEAAARNVAWVATSTAAAGLKLCDDRYGWIADTEEGFARAILAANACKAERAHRASRGRALARRCYDRGKVVCQLTNTFTTLAQRAREGGAGAS